MIKVLYIYNTYIIVICNISLLWHLFLDCQRWSRSRLYSRGILDYTKQHELIYTWERKIQHISYFGTAKTSLIINPSKYNALPPCLHFQRFFCSFVTIVQLIRLNTSYIVYNALFKILRGTIFLSCFLGPYVYVEVPRKYLLYCQAIRVGAIYM